MKKLIMAVSIFLLTITLAGCGFLPDDIEEKVTQELCANDPDHELCDLDKLDQLEEQVVIALVQESLTKINGDGCLDIVFTGNKSLMETCENSPEDLIPEGVTSLEILSFKENDGEYTVYGTTNIEGLELEIRFGVVRIEGELVFDEYEAHRLTVAAGEISEQRIDSFFDVFFKDFSDPDMSNDAFCLMYYDGEDNDCDGYRDSFFMSNTEITDHNLTRTKDYEFRGHVTVLKLHGGNEDVDVEATLVRQEFGPVQISSLVPDTEISDAQAESFFDVFLESYTDSSISNDEFCNMYYEGDQEACRIGRSVSVGDYASITPNGNMSKKGYDYYQNVSALSVSGETFEISVGLTLVRSQFGSIVVTMIDVPQAIDVIDVAEEQLSLMFADLFDPTISDSQLMEMYMIENMPDRMMIKDEFESVEFLSLDLNEDDTVSTKVRVKFKAGADLSKKVNIAFEEDDDGEMKTTYRFIDPDVMNPDIDIPYIEAYFRDYFDPEITDDEFYAMYEGPRGHAGGKKDKKRLSSSSVTINVYESGSKYLVEVTGETESERILWRLDVRVNRWESSIVMDFNDNIDNDCDGYCDSDVTNKEEHEMLFNWFIDDYFDKDITDEAFNMMYFNNMMEQDFFEIRIESLDNKNRYQIIDQVGPTGGAVFIYLLNVEDEMDPNGQIVPVKIMKRIDQSTPLLFVIDDDDDGDTVPTEAEVMSKLSDFETMANHLSIAYNVMCETFTPEHRVDACAQMVSSKIATGYQLTSFIRLQQRPDLLLAEWENAVGETMTEYYFFFPYYNDMGEVIFELIPYTLTQLDMLEIDFETYVQSLNNPLDTIDDTCAYVDESSQDECVELKTYLLQSRNEIMDYNFYYDEDLQSYVVVLNVYTSDMEFVGQAEYDVIALETNPLHQARGLRGDNPMFESNN